MEIPSANDLRNQFTEEKAKKGNGAILRVYHRTDHAERILRDMVGVFSDYVAVRLTDRPDEKGEGSVLLSFDIPTDLFEKHELSERDKPYREAFVPPFLMYGLGVLEWVCPSCDRENPARNRCCRNCGRPLSTS
jgi:hypothetical protein